jgi:hypothetical protein
MPLDDFERRRAKGEALEIAQLPMFKRYLIPGALTNIGLCADQSVFERSGHRFA